MSAFHEAIVLPAIFLTVVLAAAVRVGVETTVAAPPPGALVAAMLIVVLLVRSGALAPERLLRADRRALANLNGFVVLASTFAATAQLLDAVVPESGVPALMAWTVLVALLVQAFAMGPDRRRVLRGLAVTFGAGYTLKFILLAALSAPAEGPFGRAVRLLFEGVTLGVVTQRPAGAGEAYLSFAAVVLYLVGVAALPGAAWETVRVAAPALPSWPSGPENSRITDGS